MARKHKNIFPRRANIIGLALIFALLSVYLYQINSISGLQYKIEHIQERISALRTEYQNLTLSKENSSSLEAIRKRSQSLNMVEVESPSYLMSSSDEFAQKRY